MISLRINRIFVILFIILTTISACDVARDSIPDESNEQIINKSPTTSMDSGYPSPLNQTGTDEAYPITTEPNTQISVDNITDLPEAKSPSEGKTSFSGVLYSYSLKQLIPNTLFYLSPAIGEENSFPPIMAGPNPEQGDINGFTDEKGVIILNDIEPGNYYLIVWAPNNWGFAVINTEDEEPLMLELTGGTAHNYGVLMVQWP